MGAKETDDDHLRGPGWVAVRTGDGCRFEWLTNHPRSHVMSAEAHATISETDFERLRVEPGCAAELIAQYEPVQVIDTA